MNNIFFQCPKRILFSRIEDNQSDGNLFHRPDDGTSLCVEFPEPQIPMNLSAWQEYFRFDKNSRNALIEADFDGGWRNSPM